MPDLFEADSRGRGSPSDRNEQQLAVEGLAVLERHDDTLVVLGHALEPNAEAEVDAALAEGALELLADGFILVRDEVRKRLDDLHVGAPGLPDAGELDTDDAAAEHDDLLRHVVERQRLLGRDDPTADLEAGQRAGV